MTAVLCALAALLIGFSLGDHLGYKRGLSIGLVRGLHNGVVAAKDRALIDAQNEIADAGWDRLWKAVGPDEETT